MKVLCFEGLYFLFLREMCFEVSNGFLIPLKLCGFNEALSPSLFVALLDELTRSIED